jgi:hypothetical protein
MSWGGSGRGLLDLNGEVDLADYPALFGIGGAHDPRSGRRLVGCLRPGLEIVISPHKSVAELGVIGRAEDMHEIVDVERDATLEYLDRLVAERGGRRGRTQTRVATGGLIWATSRHATTRAGDPQVHDHVLIANAVLMRDARGGWKGADTAFLRDHLHAATAGGAWRQRPKRSSRMRDCRRSLSVRTTRRMGDIRDPGRGLRATEPNVRLLEDERSQLTSEACQLERSQQTREEFIKTHPELIDRINQLHRAIESVHASSHRPVRFARNAPTPPPITQRRSLGPAYELPRTPAIPTSPEL